MRNNWSLVRFLKFLWRFPSSRASWYFSTVQPCLAVVSEGCKRGVGWQWAVEGNSSGFGRWRVSYSTYRGRLDKCLWAEDAALKSPGADRGKQAVRKASSNLLAHKPWIESWGKKTAEVKQSIRNGFIRETHFYHLLPSRHEWISECLDISGIPSKNLGNERGTRDDGTIYKEEFTKAACKM